MSCAGLERRPPVHPVGRQRAESDRDQVLLDLEDAVGGVQLQILERGADVDAVLRIQQAAAERRGEKQGDDRPA